MRWYVGAILILAVAMGLGLSLLAYAMYALLAMMLLNRFIARSWIEQLSAQRSTNCKTAEVGDVVAVAVNVRNSGKMTVGWVLVEDLLPRSALRFNPPALKVRNKRLQLSKVPGNSSVLMNYQLECNQRGYYQIGPTVLETGDIFGLHRRYKVGSEPNYLLVYPEVVPIEGYDIATTRPIGEIQLTHRMFEDPTRIAGVREYMAGDPLNRISWRATARTGELHSKVYQPSCIAGATILLDFYRSSFKPDNEPFRSEIAVTAAASLANAVYQMGQQVGLVTNGRDAADRIRCEGWDHDYRSREAAQMAAGMQDESDRLRPVIVETRRGPEQFQSILENLARVELSDGLNLPELVLETEGRMPRDASVIAIISALTPENALALAELHRRGFAVTAIINVYEQSEFAALAGRLLAEGIPSRHLKSKESIAMICGQQMVA
ncbi:MAG: DUF58 domain-containing protein [Pirellulales bacterium]|nr:DUF58 domain-containing protein [Pirellulales bacterium]